MAIVTSHTVHIAVLPNPELLNGELNEQPMKLKTYTIGPTTHVLSQSSIATVLWHPLGEAGNCLVTVTSDSIIRLWEFDTNNRWSADSPALAMDMKKLAVATSEGEDVGPSRSGRNKVFTADAAGMEVASACFGGSGYGDESPWSPMTMWIAMKAGDIYALCPLLPYKWQPPSTLIPTLSSAIVEMAASRDDEGTTGAVNTQKDEDQLAWISELDMQEPILTSGDTEFSTKIEVYKRPAKLGPIPKLQGPFQLLPESTEEDLELSDIHVIAAKISDEGSIDADSESDSDSEAGEEEGLSASIVCLMTREARVYICLDLEGVDAQWLPRNALTRALPPIPDPYLVVLEGLDILKPGESYLSEWPTFSKDVVSRYCFFTTHSHGVYYFSFQPWVPKLEKELRTTESAGTLFRMKIFRDGPKTLRERILSIDQETESESEPSIPACLSMQDSDLGYFLLTTSKSQAQAAILDRPYNSRSSGDDFSPGRAPSTTLSTLGPPRPPYQPSPSFYATSSLPDFLNTHVQARHKNIMKEEIRLSTATLDLITEAHRVLSRETHQLGVAASQLFSRCQTMQDDLRAQIMRAGEVAKRTDQVTGEDPEGLLDGIEGKGMARAILEERIEKARERHERLVERCEELRKSVKKIESRELSEREKAWKSEIDSMAMAIEGRRAEEDPEENSKTEPREDGEVGEDDEDETQKYDETGADHLRRYREVCEDVYMLKFHPLNRATGQRFQAGSYSKIQGAISQ